MGSAKIPTMDSDFVAKKRRASSSPIGNVELLLCVGMCVGIVSAYILLKKERPEWILIAAAVVGCFVAAVLVAYAVIAGTVSATAKISVKHNKEESVESAKYIEMESLCSGSKSTFEDSVKENDGHSADCVSCMPNSASELIPGRYADIVGRVDVRQEYGIDSRYSAVVASLAAGQALKAQGMQKASEVPVNSSSESDNKDGNGKKSTDRGSCIVYGKIREACSHIICSIKEGAAGSLDDIVREWKSGRIHLTRDRNNGKIILSVGGKYVDEYILTTHTGGDPFPVLSSGVHIIYRVRFQEEFKLLRGSSVHLADARGISYNTGEDTAARYSFFCKVNAMLNYDSLVKLMFSQESQKNGNMQKLFLLYLGFYYEALKGYIKIESSFSEDVVTVQAGFTDTYLGAVFAKDIKSHGNEFDVAIEKCRELGGRARQLCDFLQAVQGKIPDTFITPDTSRSEMLFACMSCIYALTCSYSDDGYFVKNPSTVIRRLLFFVFFNSQPLREALVLQAIADEVWYIKKNERREQSFLSSVIKNLQESTSVLMRILLKPNGNHKDEMKEVYGDNAEGVGKGIVAALLLNKSTGINVDGVEGKTIGSDNADYVLCLEHYKARKGLCQNLVVDKVCGGEPGDAFKLLSSATEELVPYAVVDTIVGLSEKYGTDIVFTDSTDIDQYVARLYALKSDRIVDFLGPCKSAVAGRELFGSIMKVEVQGVVSPEESSIASVTAKQELLQCEEKESGTSVSSDLCAVDVSPGGGYCSRAGVDSAPP
ncbi:hypothetical protein [Anaplasma bovis]|uniref:hypothetical protein n=1 Tax=Anaplasma bovis TaxID=186733 RepID=UPI002FEF1817